MKKHNQFLKNSVSFDVFKIKKKSKTLKKCPSDEIFKKKKHSVNKKNTLKKKKSEDIIPVKNKNLSDLNLKKIMNENSTSQKLASNELKNLDDNNISFSNFFYNFMDKEIKKSKNETGDDNNEFSKNLKKMKYIRKFLTSKNKQT